MIINHRFVECFRPDTPTSFCENPHGVKVYLTDHISKGMALESFLDLSTYFSQCFYDPKADRENCVAVGIMYKKPKPTVLKEGEPNTLSGVLRLNIPLDGDRRMSGHPILAWVHYCMIQNKPAVEKLDISGSWSESHANGIKLFLEEYLKTWDWSKFSESDALHAMVQCIDADAILLDLRDTDLETLQHGLRGTATIYAIRWKTGC